MVIPPLPLSKSFITSPFSNTLAPRRCRRRDPARHRDLPSENARQERHTSPHRLRSSHKLIHPTQGLQPSKLSSFQFLPAVLREFAQDLETRYSCNVYRSSRSEE